MIASRRISAVGGNQLPISEPLRIAMWSGPRNISTAMMRSWGNRPDTVVCDEPLYAYYLKQTGSLHPGADEVIRHHESDWGKVVEWLTGPIPAGKTVSFQKQMSHHLLPEVGREWLDGLTHGFLIRDPGEMLASLSRLFPYPELADTGLPQQVEIFERVRKNTGRVPPVVDAKDVLAAPEPMLRRLCDALGVEFSDSMMSWPTGPRETDGIWAKYWYKEVVKTTGFLSRAPRSKPAPEELGDLHRECRAYYELLRRHRLRPDAA
jgi:hypothetical protein